MQLIWYRSSKSADRQRPKPARIVPFVVIRIGFGTDWSLDRVASSNSTITPVRKFLQRAMQPQLFWGTNNRTPFQPAHRGWIERRRDRRNDLWGVGAAKARVRMWSDFIHELAREIGDLPLTVDFQWLSSFASQLFVRLQFFYPM